MTGELVTSSRRDFERSDLVWGADDIAAFLNLTPRQVYGQIDRLPITKIGGKLCASRSKLIEACTGGGKRGGAR
jgi:hypothetical protein